MKLYLVFFFLLTTIFALVDEAQTTQVTPESQKTDITITTDSGKSFTIDTDKIDTAHSLHKVRARRAFSHFPQPVRKQEVSADEENAIEDLEDIFDEIDSSISNISKSDINSFEDSDCSPNYEDDYCTTLKDLVISLKLLKTGKKNKPVKLQPEEAKVIGSFVYKYGKIFKKFKEKLIEDSGDNEETSETGLRNTGVDLKTDLKSFRSSRVLRTNIKSRRHHQHHRNHHRRYYQVL